MRAHEEIGGEIIFVTGSPKIVPGGRKIFATQHSPTNNNVVVLFLKNHSYSLLIIRSRVFWSSLVQREVSLRRLSCNSTLRWLLRVLVDGWTVSALKTKITYVPTLFAYNSQCSSFFYSISLSRNTSIYSKFGKTLKWKYQYNLLTLLISLQILFLN